MSEYLGAPGGGFSPVRLPPAGRRPAIPSLQIRLAASQQMSCQALVQASTLARLADLAYGKKRVLPYGYIDITHDSHALAKLNLTPALLNVSDDHFRARVFSSVQGFITHYVVAFAGTDPTNAEDDEADIEQAFGYDTSQYRDASSIGYKLHLIPSTIPIVLTGHSLGGGLATEAAFYSGRPAVIFNSAGLHRNNIPKGVKPPSVDAYSVDGDPLTFLQTRMRLVLSWAAFSYLPAVSWPSYLIFGDPLGGAIPPAYGRSITVPDRKVARQGVLGAMMDRHSIGRVERDLDQLRIVLQCR
ncbi:alpha/beta hydrolase family protein [Acidomonas methanolica]|uniref:hypothetical protein n=1 Tax=Acidomonas methanolica TaxID=437 RepID=UPI00211A14B3|nr:hypothetical protein [Acidomonas methanolica]MCQ9156520.1 DUF2974 domain-containing protein [Acidomonas methanolica]